MGNGGTIALLGSAFVALFLLVSAAPSNNLPSTASSYYTDTPCDCLKLRNISLNSGEDFDSSEEEEILEELQSGLDVLQRLGNTLLNAPPSPPECEVGQSIVCFAHDRYQHFSRLLLETQPDDELYSDVIGSHLVSWNVLSTSCKWLALYSTPGLVGNCSLDNISDMCLDFSLFKLRDQVRRVDLITLIDGFGIAGNEQDFARTLFVNFPIAIERLIQ